MALPQQPFDVLIEMSCLDEIRDDNRVRSCPRDAPFAVLGQRPRVHGIEPYLGSGRNQRLEWSHVALLVRYLRTKFAESIVGPLSIGLPTLFYSPITTAALKLPAVPCAGLLHADSSRSFAGILTQEP